MVHMTTATSPTKDNSSGILSDLTSAENYMDVVKEPIKNYRKPAIAY